MLDLNERESFDCVTDGSGDFGVDAMQVTEEVDGEFSVTLVQAKYKNKLDADAHFEEGGIKAMVNAIRHIFDPYSDLGAINDRLGRFFPAGFCSSPRWISATVSAEMNRSVSACSDIHSSREGEGLG